LTESGSEPFGARFASTLGVRQSGRALRDFATYLPTQALPALAGFLALPIIARRVTPAELGVLAIAQTLITLGWSVSSQWLTTAVMRELPAARASETLGPFVRTLRRASAVSAVFFVGFCVCIGAIALVSDSVSSTYWFVLGASAGLAIQAIAVTLFAAELRTRAYAIVDVLSRVGGIALGVALVFEGHAIHGYLLWIAEGSLLVGGLGLAAAWPKGARASGPPRVSQWLRYGVPASAAASGVWLLLLVDRYLLAVLKDTAAVGVYSVGNVIGDRAVALPTFAFFVAARPLLVRAFEQGGRSELERMMREYTRVMLLLGAAAVAAAAAAASTVVPVLAGPTSYDAAVGVVPIVALGSFILALALIGNTSLVIARRTRPLIYAALIGLAVNVGANLVLIPWLGIKGAAIATPIGNASFLLAGQDWARRQAAWHVPRATAARAATAAVVAFGAGKGLERLVADDVPRLLVSTGATLAVYVLVLALLGERRSASA
jgi:O-antigen/teichoic acid export membrane protein